MAPMSQIEDALEGMQRAGSAIPVHDHRTAMPVYSDHLYFISSNISMMYLLFNILLLIPGGSLFLKRGGQKQGGHLGYYIYGLRNNTKMSENRGFRWNKSNN